MNARFTSNIHSSTIVTFSKISHGILTSPSSSSLRISVSSSFRAREIDRTIDSAGAMHAPSKFIWLHYDEINGFPQVSLGDVILKCASIIVLPIFMIATLLAIIAYHKRKVYKTHASSDEANLKMQLLLLHNSHTHLKTYTFLLQPVCLK